MYQLPAALADLVPGRLEAVPLDPYDGQPLRYSREKGILYSVGEDFTDQGGSSAQEWQEALEDRSEPTLRLEE